MHRNYYVVGWYSTGSNVEESDKCIHKALMDINKSPVYVLLNPSIYCVQKDLSVTIYESEPCVGDGIPRLIFVRASYTIETEEAKRIYVDPVALPKPSGGGTMANMGLEEYAQHKSMLRHYMHRRKMSDPFYDTIEVGSKDAPGYRSTVTIDGERFTSDKFPKKKKAEQDAARIALFHLSQKTKDEGCHQTHEIKRKKLVELHAGNENVAATGSQDAPADILVAVSEKHIEACVVQNVTVGNVSSCGVEGSLREESHSQLMDRSEHSLLGGENQMKEGTEIMQIEENENLEVESGSDISPNQSLALPFVKTSRIWKATESLEVFQKFPQAPHFLSLSNSKDGCCEGLIFAKMVSFASTVQVASKLEITDSRSRFTTCLEDLQNLENDGFNVQEIKPQLTRLLSIKDGHDKLKEESNEAEAQITSRENENVRIEENIAKIIEERSRLKEEKKLALEKKEKRDLEIKTLRTSDDIRHHLIQSTKNEFEECLNNLLRVRRSGGAGNRQEH